MKLILTFVILVTIEGTLQWNIETRFPIIFRKDPKSYFGYSVSLHENNNGNMALVTATRANSAYRHRKNLHQPGALYKCNITTTECEEVNLEKHANEISGIYHAREEDMWLGVSLDVQPNEDGHIVTCGHRWVNQLHSGYYLMNGVCYLMDRNMRKITTKKLLPFVDQDKQSIGTAQIFYYAFGSAGMSVAFSENGANLLIGCPGFYDWIGTVISYKVPKSPRYAILPQIPDPPADQHPMPDSYIGYSVTSGRFYELGQQQFVAGAPRDWNNRGRIYIFEELNEYRTSMIVVDKKEGEQLGEYFGAAVLGVNTNNDSYTDLLVGSPLYSLPSGGDEGKVYYFISNGAGLERSHDLHGSKHPQARFGTTIANAGDLNQDGYLDVAIGAPYEEGKGAVYIYQGSNAGLNSAFSQRITASEVDSSLSGFGISISRGKDIDSNKYPDLLIGSYTSDRAVILRTRPIVYIFPAIRFHPEKITSNSSLCNFKNSVIPCFNTSFCLIYLGKHLPEELDISVKLSSARQSDVLKPRRYFLFQNQLSTYIYQNITIKKDQRECFFHDTFISTDPDDFITPIHVALKVWLTHDVKTEETFCATCPILNSYPLPRIATKILTFQTGCDKDNICTSDLKLTMNVHGLSSEKLILGLDKVITLTVEIQNNMELAYKSELEIILPQKLQIINQDNCRQSSEQSVNIILLCSVGNPFRSGQLAKYDIKLDTSLISTDLEYLVFSAFVTTASEEVTPDDNYANATVYLKALADITIVGYPEQEQVVLGKVHIESGVTPFVHVYTILKYLPSTVNSVSVELFVPTTFVDSEIEFIRLTSIQINNDKSEAAPGSCNVSLVDFHPETGRIENSKDNTNYWFYDNTVGTARPKRSVDNEKSEVVDVAITKAKRYTNYALNCRSSVCKKIMCIAGPFTQKHRSATFHIHGYINVTVLQTNLERWDNITITSEGRVKIRDPKGDIQPQNHKPDNFVVTTTLIQSAPLPAQKIAKWILPVSIGIGLFLFFLILMGLIKLGFFKRKKKEVMEKMLTQAKLKEWDPYLIKDENKEVVKDANCDKNK